MKEQIKAIIYDFKNAGWTVQRVEQELKFSNGSLGKPISDFRYSKLLELHQKEIKKPVTVTKELAEKIEENNKPENKNRILAEREGETKTVTFNLNPIPVKEFKSISVKEEIPPMPVKEKGEDSIDFAARKSEWKKKYNI